MTLRAVLIGALALLAVSASAQIDDDRVFNLSTSETLDVAADSLEVAPKYIPHLEGGSWDFGLTLGYLGLEKTLLRHPQMIYKATSEAFYYGDVELIGSSAFTPVVRAAYNVTPYFGLEAQAGLSFGDFTSRLDNVAAINPNSSQEGPQPVNALGEFDAEDRSFVALFTNLHALLYPLNLDGDGQGRWHPYVTAGVGRAQYDLDSNYTDEPANSVTFNFGGGVRVIADDFISVRLEVVQLVHSIEFEPAPFFDTRDEDTVVVPVYKFDPVSGAYSEIEAFESESLGGLSWSIGVVTSF